MSADVAHELRRKVERERVVARTRSARARILLALGPATSIGGLAWAVVQPWRLTLLHPFGQGFYWLLAEPPLYVVLVGILFRLLIVPGIVADLEEQR
ncbi:MAG TPA: hypothetical protein VII51_06405 [Gaiellaceae bacterium]